MSSRQRFSHTDLTDLLNQGLEDEDYGDGGQGRPVIEQTRQDIRKFPALPSQRGFAGLRAPALDKNTSSVSAPRKHRDDPAPGARRRKLFQLREGLRRITANDRVAKCGHVHVDRLPSVHLVKDSSGKARYQGVLTCGNVWLCPVCGPRIAHSRGKKLETLLAAWIAQGGSVLFLTLTLPHDLADSLEGTSKAMTRAFTRLLVGRRWLADQRTFGIAGFVRTLEVTLGQNGWHPHLHVLLFFESQLAHSDEKALHSSLYERFATGVWNAGFRRPDIRNCPLRNVGRKGIGKYISKAAAAFELTSWHTKRGRDKSRTWLDLLSDVIARHEPADLARWQEWEMTMFGRRQLTWSRGIESRLRDMAAEELEIIKKEQTKPVALISRVLWRLIRSTPGLDLRLLEAAETGGYAAAFELVRRTAGRFLLNLPYEHFWCSDPETCPITGLPSR
jgi:hypothetical protein